jgi:predicted kinase
MEAKLWKGCYSLIIPKEKLDVLLDRYLLTIPGKYEESRFKRDGEKYHMTLITNGEKPGKIDIPELENHDFLMLGLGKTKKAFYLICHYPEGDRIRKELKLPPFNFHITLGFDKTDDHTVVKDISTLYKPNVEDMNKLLDYKTQSRVKWLNILDRMIKLDFYNLTDYEEYEWWYYYITGWANVQKFDKVDSYLPHLIDIEPLMGYYIKLKINKIIRKIDPQDILNAYDAIKDRELLDKYKKEMNELMVLMNDDVGLDLKIKFVIRDNYMVGLRAPRNLTRIIVPGKMDKMVKLYGSGMINTAHADFLNYMSFDMVLNLTEKSSPIEMAIHNVYCHSPIDDRTPPTMEQLYNILHEMDKCDKVIVHCVGGKGRTNTIIIAYLIWKLNIRLSDSYKCIKNRGIAFSNSQTEFLKEFEKNEIKMRSIKHITIKNNKKPHIIVLVGLPCSGKSTLSNHLTTECPDNVIHLNQDELGRGKYLKQLLVNAEKINKNIYKFILVDKCNTTKEERKIIIDLSKKHKLKTLCIWLDISINELMMRSKQRKDHPVLSSKKTAEVIIEKNKNFELPDPKEGFSEIVHLKDEDELNDLLEKWQLSTINMYESNYFKFPRSRHLYSLGSAQRDDLLISKEEQNKFLNTELYVEEKIDGANLGISIDKDDMGIKFQNRSHYVTSSTHQQFSKLDKWIDTYGNHLYDILEPGRHILFGEWVYLQHTVPYDNLPSYFIAFDMYDKKEQKFFARKYLQQILNKTTIPLIPLVYEGKLKSKKDTLDLLKQPSKYGNTLIEGIYLKIPDDDKKYIINRGKVVRENFIADDAGFWTHNTKPNRLSEGSYV